VLSEDVVFGLVGGLQHGAAAYDHRVGSVIEQQVHFPIDDGGVRIELDMESNELGTGVKRWC
jgi:hypothetical protein